MYVSRNFEESVSYSVSLYVSCILLTSIVNVSKTMYHLFVSFSYRLCILQDRAATATKVIGVRKKKAAPRPARATAAARKKQIDSSDEEEKEEEEEDSSDED